ncbi:MAG TPA: hypothetical protein VFK16_08380 [Gemmatimonadaceae bacterium]|nr:hypothetical protein [Gemmatimonadaceae bacterium]
MRRDEGSTLSCRQIYTPDGHSRQFVVHHDRRKGACTTMVRGDQMPHKVRLLLGTVLAGAELDKLQAEHLVAEPTREARAAARFFARAAISWDTG